MALKTDEVGALVEQLRQIESRIAELTGGAVDAVLDQYGRSWLLSDAQQDLHDRADWQRRLAEQQSAILDALPAHVALLDGAGCILTVNHAWREFGDSNVLDDPQYTVGVNYLAVCDQATGPEAEEAHQVAEGIRSVLDGRVAEYWREYPCHAPYQKRWFRLTVSPLPASAGHGAVVMHIDVTDRKLTEIELRRSASVFQSSTDGVLITDANLVALDVNPAYTFITGYPRDDVMGRRGRLLNEELQAPERLTEVREYLRQNGHWSGEVRNRRRDGDVYLEQLAITVIRDDSGSIVNYILVFSDVTSLRAHEAELDRVAHYDELTGLPNRRLLGDRLEQALRQARREGDRLAICYLDLDHFKPVNDRYGHAVGDKLLVSVARRLQEALREADTVCRIGGDEFVVLLPGTGEVAELEGVLSRVMDQLRLPFSVEGRDLSIAASMGVTVYPDDEAEAELLLRHADQAMYTAKESGRNRIAFYDASGARLAEERASRLQTIVRGLEQGEFVMHYQPKVRLADGSVAGVEALVRWQHPDHGLLAPAEFLDLIIGSELEKRFGDYVLETVVSQLSAWRRAGLTLSASINVSDNELRAEDLVSRIQQTLARYPDTRLSQLEIELVETAAIQDLEQATLSMQRCRAAGVRVALDDFGTGYSSLTLFRRLPVDVLKIDKSFVRDMLDNHDDRGIVETVVRMGHAFHRTVIAEGVETMEHARALHALGCHEAQGYGIARPLPAGAVADWIAYWAREQPWQAIQAGS